MAQVVIRTNLAASSFPFLSEFSGRGIVVKQQDQNYVPAIGSSADPDKDIGIPQLYYCENVIPTSQGYQSVGYEQRTAPVSSSVVFDQVFSVIGPNSGEKAFIGRDALFNGLYYMRDPNYDTWTSIGASANYSGTITTAYVNGTTYVFFAKKGCYKYDFAGNTLTAVALAGLTVANMLGIVAVQGYMLAWSKSAIAWSSLIDPTDFVPSLITGAGGGSVQGARGDLVACISHTIGLVIYTNQNAVAAPTSGNTRYPFNFRELVASGGLASIDKVTYDANSGNHYAYTTSGMQLISLQQTQTVFPEVTDFLAGSVFESFDPTLEALVTEHLTSTMSKKLTLISDRYLCISYGISYGFPSYSHVIIYDLSLKRWGKLAHNHYDIFEFSLLAAETVETPRHSIALLGFMGNIDIVNIDTRDSSDGLIIMGKYQYVRSRVLKLDTVEIENVQPGDPIRCIDRYALDGKTTANAAGTLLSSSGQVRKFGFNKTALNHSLLIRGAFNLVSMVMAFHVGGRR